MRGGREGRVRGQARQDRRRGRRARREAETRQRILDAATRLFSEDGFRRVTVRQICREAHANVASVNYYFGDKLGLYREIVQGALAAMHSSDPTIEAPPDSSAEDRVRHYVRTYVPRLARPAGPAVWMQKLMAHEIQEPTPLAAWIAQQVVVPRIRYLSAAIAEILGCPADDPRIGRCVISLQAQCLFHMPNQFRSAAFPEEAAMTDTQLRQMAEHIAEFSLAGIGRIAQDQT
jgi:TetR/AcrR family transcriptional regulator, regulator of cefoperazone and chloramphenicol sensitivity